MELQNDLIEIISLSGNVKKKFLKAVKYAKNDEAEKAEEIYREADDQLINAHLKQTELIKKEANGEKIESSLMLTHAQDHLMTAILLRDMAKEFMDLYTRLENE
ncbi:MULTISPECIES: PTS lactose/cellobiose transporter subunit IIA [Halanaerobium]|jgi:PTS system cellobiose-specific IIA component/PTS system lactose-specific IIA component|uniref:PTS system cellobiose-specific IIA component/PTS system lactose-specific IIA component n=1 Tax=Halanaerobium congolense TaxID=54121 RepID=A0A1G9T2Z4_9FIRM|nr:MULTISPECIES: PTS lactose/cellobiose transporter subunit IIA [Halanaerobium]KXS49548.1 MAG: PTS system, cellobiose-specific IIA component [Halanaerobium sp. T82-1]PTX17591.1 PTS system cellobiose-specific IIA component/PTS system lactose-specific IIA component [Halanaerobium congolense]PUU91286.1 MAG: PTS system, cellobiose-specific IIA component [Halanaerobium sp.]TDP12299.1 PTS system cellobiose-specific IIA component/PTS system lactose-specific IIA component [Halanaerobium congolense]TDS